MEGITVHGESDSAAGDGTTMCAVMTGSTKNGSTKGAGQDSAEQKVVDQNAADQKVVDQNAADQKVVDQKVVDQKVVDREPADPKPAKQKFAEQNREGRHRAPYRYHLVLCAEHFVFADAVDKYEMLRQIAVSGITEKCLVSGFVLLDREMHLLVTTRDGRPAQDLLDAYEAYRKYWLRRYKGVTEDMFRAAIQCIPVPEKCYLDELLNIHMLAVTHHYVKDINFYWWSSYQTYRGEFKWPFVSEEEILRALSGDVFTARGIFRRAQRAKYNLKMVKWQE